jgi:hypothetical protein
MDHGKGYAQNMKQTSSKRSKRSTKPGNTDFRFEPLALVRAAQEAIRDALREHKRVGNPVVGTKNGKIVLVQPEQIDV